MMDDPGDARSVLARRQPPLPPEGEALLVLDYPEADRYLRAFGSSELPDIAVLPRNFVSGPYKSKWVYERSTWDIQKFGKQVGLDISTLSRDVVAIDENDAIAIGVVLLVGYKVLETANGLGALAEFFNRLGSYMRREGHEPWRESRGCSRSDRH